MLLRSASKLASPSGEARQSLERANLRARVFQLPVKKYFSNDLLFANYQKGI
jgi:hypothetical protein